MGMKQSQNVHGVLGKRKSQDLENDRISRRRKDVQDISLGNWQNNIVIYFNSKNFRKCRFGEEIIIFILDIE